MKIHHKPVVDDVKVLRPIDAKDEVLSTQRMKTHKGIILLVYGLLLFLGIGTGYLLSAKTNLGTTSTTGGVTTNTVAKVVGVKDAIFKDCATGVIEKEGLNGEGTHKLIREGGPSQTAYLLSSIVDMDQYVGLTVKVCGQTIAAKKVSWLMDVGRLEFQTK